MRNWIALGICSTALVACAEARQPRQAMLDVANAPVCCKSVEDLPYEQVAVPAAFTFELDERSPVYEFPDGKSYFKALALPRADKPYRLTVRSYVRRIAPWDVVHFYPAVVLLNEKKETTATIRPQDFQMREVRFLDEPLEVPRRLEAVVEIDPAKEPPRYLVIFSNADKIAPQQFKVPPTMTMVPAGGGVFIPVMAGGGGMFYPPSPTGRVQLRIDPVP